MFFRRIPSGLEEIAGQYESAEKITLVMDNLNTHAPGSLYEMYPPDKAKALWDRFEFVYTPKHGSWLNMAEIELSEWIFGKRSNGAVPEKKNRRYRSYQERGTGMAGVQKQQKRQD